MAPAVHIVVSCTKRKTRAPDPGLLLRSIPHGSLSARGREWLRRLRSARGAVPVSALYAGDHWVVARSLAGAATPGGEVIELWVCSAGLGLVSLAAEVPPYGATFVPGDPDSVAGEAVGPEARRCCLEWWRLLATWEGPQPGCPRTLADLVRQRHPAAVVVVASQAYLGAMSEDLGDAALALGDPERLAILSAGCDDLGPLTPHLLPCDARLQSVVGGALASLNVRVARTLLLRWCRAPVRRSLLRRQLQQRLARHLVTAPHRRERLAGEEVQTFIRAALEREPGVRASALLRRLRDSGRACEQARFTTLFRQVREGLHGD